MSIDWEEIRRDHIVKAGKVRRVSCPRCSAPVGESCHSPAWHEYVRGHKDRHVLAESGGEIDRLRAVLALIDTPYFLHLGPGHSTLHDDKGEEVAGAEPGEHELWVRLHTMDALEQIKAAQPEEKL